MPADAAHDHDCRLCTEEDPDWREGSFFGVTCDTCHVPMVVLDEHRAELTWREQLEFGALRKRRFPDHHPRDRGMRSIRDHWHWHMIPEDR